MGRLCLEKQNQIESKAFWGLNSQFDAVEHQQGFVFSHYLCVGVKCCVALLGGKLYLFLNSSKSLRYAVRSSVLKLEVVCR